MQYRITEHNYKNYPTLYLVDKKTWLFYRTLRSSIPAYASLEEALQAIAKDKLG